MKLRVIINTYNRPRMCESLVNSVRRQYFGVSIDVYNDGGEVPRLDARTTIYNLPHKGRRYYYAMWQRIFANLKRDQNKFTHVLFLPDDVTLTDGAITSMVRQFTEVEARDSEVVGLVPILDRRGFGPNWVPIDAKEQHGLMLTRWFDCCGIVNKQFFRVLNWHIAEVPQAHFDANESSGVGSQITKRLYILDKNIYHVKETLLHHGDHPSKMHPKERERNPL